MIFIAKLQKFFVLLLGNGIEYKLFMKKNLLLTKLTFDAENVFLNHESLTYASQYPKLSFLEAFFDQYTDAFSAELKIMKIRHFNKETSLTPLHGRLSQQMSSITLRERLRTHKVFTKDQRFTLIIISSP